MHYGIKVKYLLVVIDTSRPLSTVHVFALNIIVYDAILLCILFKIL